MATRRTQPCLTGLYGLRNPHRPAVMSKENEGAMKPDKSCATSPDILFVPYNP